MDRSLLSFKEIGIVLGLSVYQVAHFVEDEKLEVYQFGGLKCVDEDSFFYCLEKKHKIKKSLLDDKRSQIMKMREEKKAKRQE